MLHIIISPPRPPLWPRPGRCCERPATRRPKPRPSITITLLLLIIIIIITTMIMKMMIMMMIMIMPRGGNPILETRCLRTRLGAKHRERVGFRASCGQTTTNTNNHNRNNAHNNIYIYIYIEREREIHNICIHICVYVYIYIYTYTCLCPWPAPRNQATSHERLWEAGTNEQIPQPHDDADIDTDTVKTSTTWYGCAWKLSAAAQAREVTASKPPQLIFIHIHQLFRILYTLF